MATTVRGVAFGTAIGQSIAQAFTGMFGCGGSRDQVQPQQAPVKPMEQSSQQGGACDFEIKQFLKCAQKNDENLSVCSGFNKAVLKCMKANRLI